MCARRTGSSLSQGVQSYMEDRISVYCDLVKQQYDKINQTPTGTEAVNATVAALGNEFLSDPSPLAYVGVFDGHSGDYVANRLQDDFHSMLFSNLLKGSEEMSSRKEKDKKSRSWKLTKMISNEALPKDTDGSQELLKPSACSLVEQALSDTCAAIDRVIMDEDNARQKEFLAARYKTASLAFNEVARTGHMPEKHRKSSLDSQRFAGLHTPLLAVCVVSHYHTLCMQGRVV